MHIARLSLTNVRTFRRLDTPLERGISVVTGPNGAGKTNLVEAIGLLATTRSGRTGADAEVISQAALREEPLPAATLHAEVVTAAEPVTVEIVVSSLEVRDRAAAEEGALPPTSRRFRVDGVARRASDLIGRLRVVMFSAADLQIIDGSPSRRRRYLDITISQLDREYVRALQRYQRVLQQRNSLLRSLQERRARTGDELAFWDQELAASGAVVLHGRALAVRALAEGAAGHYADLAPGFEPLAVCYEPALPAPAAATVLDAGSVEGVEAAFREVLEARRRDDLVAGVTRSGPHRDNMRFEIAGNDAAAFASRGQQRTAGRGAAPRRGRALPRPHGRRAAAAPGRHPVGARRAAPRARARGRLRRRPGRDHLGRRGAPERQRPAQRAPLPDRGGRAAPRRVRARAGSQSTSPLSTCGLPFGAASV